ncbi:MAG TPA: hypothetical protein EYG73_03110 [Arcobacter sp.]|nr:hypothetical protein [Arcobacter sp.]
MTTVPQVAWALGFGGFAILLTFIPFVMAWHNYTYTKSQINNHLPTSYFMFFFKVTAFYFLVGGLFFAGIKIYDFFISRVIDRFGSIKLFEIFWSTTINTGDSHDGTLGSLYYIIYFIKEIIFTNFLVIFSIIYFFTLIGLILYKASYSNKKRDKQDFISVMVVSLFDFTLGVMFYKYIYVGITDLILHWGPLTVETVFTNWWIRYLL